jgi:nicotinamide riboside transporter PnuC
MDQKIFKQISRRLVIELAVVVALVGFPVDFPQHVSSAVAWKFVLHHPTLLLHVIVGTLIIVEAAILLVRALRSKHLFWIILAILGLIFVLGAFASGERYVALQTDSALTNMSNLWFGAIVCYGVGWYWGRRKSQSPTVKPLDAKTN